MEQREIKKSTMKAYRLGLNGMAITGHIVVVAKDKEEAKRLMQEEFDRYNEKYNKKYSHVFASEEDLDDLYEMDIERSKVLHFYDGWD